MQRITIKPIKIMLINQVSFVKYQDAMDAGKLIVGYGLRYLT